jgi:hypothetical protein
MVRGGDKLSLHAKRALNAIYYLVQKNVNNGKASIIENLDYIPIEFPYLRKMMGLEKVESYIKEIENALTELQTTAIQLNNFKDPRDNKIWNWYSISFMSDVSWHYDEEKKKKVAYISLSPLVKWLMIHSNEENFTKLDLIPTLNNLRTKYAMKLYEFFKSFEKFRYIDLPQDYLLRILGLEEIKTYHSYYELKRLLQRQIKELNKKTEFDKLKLIEPTKEMKREKIYRFIINPKNKKVLKDRKKIEEMTANLFKRF